MEKNLEERKPINIEKIVEEYTGKRYFSDNKGAYLQW